MSGLEMKSDLQIFRERLDAKLEAQANEFTIHLGVILAAGIAILAILKRAC
jgi:hypothetical protein